MFSNSQHLICAEGEKKEVRKQLVLVFEKQFCEKMILMWEMNKDDISPCIAYPQ